MSADGSAEIGAVYGNRDEMSKAGLEAQSTAGHVIMEEHLPKRPAWDCDNCGQTWPCANAKANLLCEYLASRTVLLIYLSLRHWEAFDDFAALGEIPVDLNDRFFGWVR